MDEVSRARGSRVLPSPRVSVVIPAYQPTWLDEALQSVRRQTFTELEIVVVDDGSPTPVAPAVTDDLVLVRQPNGGPGGARNRGVAEARGEWIAFLDSDDRWLPQKLERQLEAHAQNPSWLLSCHDLRLMSGEPRRATNLQPGVIPYERVFYENCIGCSTVMVRREAYQRAGGMTPHRRMGEDYALYLRLGLLGPMGYVPGVWQERRVHADSLMQAGLRDFSWIAEERAIYDELLAEHPELRARPFVRPTLARFEHQAGYTYLSRGRWDDARRALARSIGHAPLRPKTWIDLARAVLHIGARGR